FKKCRAAREKSRRDKNQMKNALIPVVDFNIMRRRPAFTCFNKFFETQHEYRPLHAAMRSKLYSFTPVSVAKNDYCKVAFLVQIECCISANPLLRTLNKSPLHPSAWVKCLYFHGHAAEFFFVRREKADHYRFSD